MTITLITGGNRGIGYETARRLVAAGHIVWIGARDARRGREAAHALGASSVQLDVTDDASVAAAVDTVREQAGHLDVLINNAGILGDVTSPEDMTVDQIRAVYETNVFGVVRVTNAFLPLLRQAAHPSVVNVTSGLGSFTLIHDPERIESQYPLAAYGSSKTAVTMLPCSTRRRPRTSASTPSTPGRRRRSSPGTSDTPSRTAPTPRSASRPGALTRLRGR
jgi:NAD(P)-dependent dehydrogenase (short-subunit alcohol dehydrogenase family)